MSREDRITCEVIYKKNNNNYSEYYKYFINKKILLNFTIL